jgi:antitoxin ParD1/3/4
MPTRNVVLTRHNEDVIEALVGSGRYQNASEVLRAGLRLIEREEAREAVKLEALRTAVNAGFEEIDQGRWHELASDDIAGFIEELGQKVSERVRASRG